MAQTSQVKTMYDSFVKEGLSPKEAAKKAQRITGDSVVSGQQIKQRGPVHKTKRKWLYGTYD